MTLALKFLCLCDLSVAKWAPCCRSVCLFFFFNTNKAVSEDSALVSLKKKYTGWLSFGRFVGTDGHILKGCPCYSHVLVGWSHVNIYNILLSVVLSCLCEIHGEFSDFVYFSYRYLKIYSYIFLALDKYDILVSQPH